MGALTREMSATPVTGDTRELVAYVLERCSGKNDTEIRLALANALRRFLKESKAWREPLTPLDAGTENPGYIFAAGAFGELETVCEIRGPGQLRLPPPAYACDDGRTVIFEEALREGAVPYAAFVPARGDDHAPVRIFRKYGEAICRGALHELATGGQLSAATSWKALYDNDVSEALLSEQPRTAGTMRADYGAEVI